MSSCWSWTRAKSLAGYGQFRKNDICYYVHRIAWERKNGIIPKGYDICHHCDNRACFRPSHLFAGTRHDNMQDAAKKNRMPRYEKHWASKVTKSQIIEMKILYSSGNIKQYELAKKYGIDKAQISRWLKEEVNV